MNVCLFLTRGLEFVCLFVSFGFLVVAPLNIETLRKAIQTIHLPTSSHTSNSSRCSVGFSVDLMDFSFL